MEERLKVGIWQPGSEDNFDNIVRLHRQLNQQLSKIKSKATMMIRTLGKLSSIPHSTITAITPDHLYGCRRTLFVWIRSDKIHQGDIERMGKLVFFSFYGIPSVHRIR